ncbi:MAG: response regulator transcription factor [Gammaproteobacteria bacterium]
MREPIVFVVDDDQAMTESLSWVIESIGLKTQTFTSAHAFLDTLDTSQPGCLLLDVRMPEISGPELQSLLKHQGTNLPIIFISGHGDIPLAVRAMKEGAIDFLTKPFNDQMLIESINKAIRTDHENRLKQHQSDAIRYRFDQLTPREKEVMSRIVVGKLNKVISAELDISLKTVEAHRASVMKKMQMKSLPELVEASIRSDLFRENP